MSNWGANEAIRAYDRKFVGPLPCTDQYNETPAYLARAVQAIREGTSVADLLRIGGAGLMVFSLSLFLMQGMEATSDLHRYLLLLGQTGLLTAAGFAVGFVLKEPRGARVFFSLALISIPANFAVLGAMIYSIVPLDNLITQYPGYASWQSTNLKELSMAAAAGLLVLVPMSLFCFAVLARHSRWWLSSTYLLASAALLVPVRDSLSISVISGLCALAVVACLSHRRAKRQGLATREEQFAKALLFIPAVLILARSAALYDVDFYVALAVVIAVHYVLRRLVVARSGHTVLTVSLRVLTAACAVLLAVMLTTLIHTNMAFITPLPIFTLAWLVLNLDLIRLIDSKKFSTMIHGTWSVINFSGIAIASMVFGSADGFLVNLGIAAVILAASTVTRQKLGAVLGTVGIMVILILNGAHLFSFVLATGWAGVAIAGALTIVSGSVLERFWPVIKIRLIHRFSVSKSEDSDTDSLEPEEDLISLPADQTIPKRQAA